MDNFTTKRGLTVSTSIYILVVVYAFLRPYPASLLGSSGLRLIDVTVFLVVALPLCVDTSLRISKVVILVLCSFILFSTSALLSNLLSFGYFIDSSSVLDAIRMLMLAPFLLLGFKLGEGKGPYYLYIVLKVIFFFSFIVAFIQYFEVQGVSYLNALYGDEDKLANNFKLRRAVSVYGNPNTYAIFTIILFWVIKYLKSFYSYAGLGDKLLTVLSIVSVLFSSSKTGFILLLITWTVYLYFNSKRALLIFLTVFIVALPLILLILQNVSPYAHQVLLLVFSIDVDGVISSSTVGARVDGWKDAYAYFIMNPLFGSGGLRGVIPSATDNFYLYLLSRYGIAGLILFFVHYLLILLEVRKCQKKVEYALIIILGLLMANLVLEASILISVSYLVTMFFGLIITNYKREYIENSVSTSVL